MFVCLWERDWERGGDGRNRLRQTKSLGKGTKTRAILKARYFYFLSDSSFFGTRENLKPKFQRLLSLWSISWKLKLSKLSWSICIEASCITSLNSFLQTSLTCTLLCNHAKTQTHINTQISTSACRQLLLQIQPIPFCCHNAFKSFINHPILRIRHFLTKTIRTYSYLIHEGSDHQNFAYDFESIEFSTWETNRKVIEAIKLSVLLFFGFFFINLTNLEWLFDNSCYICFKALNLALFTFYFRKHFARFPTSLRSDN